MKKASIFGIIAFTLLSFNAIWSFFSTIKRYNELKGAGAADTNIFQTFVLPLFSAVASVMLLIFFVGLYRKQK